MTEPAKPEIKPIRTLLIANRNEIACRIIKAARQLGMKTVAVYSDADRNALHVGMADEAWCLGGPAPLDSYLKIDRLIDVASACGADAIHPGYGFVSENPLFAAACERANITLVGPTSQAMADMADKARAKEIAESAGLPCIPGYNEASASLDNYQAAAARIGYPVMVKALAGGGGRGMRLVQAEADLISAIHSAKSEALNAFGDDRVMLEKAVIRPRHVEVQVLADQYGHAVHLGERDCSVQRRHQKIVEEAPSPAVDESLRHKMGQAALKLVQATGYVGAGTVEFLLDESGQFYFIEMNTRLQVEHGVTELITGIDLVQWQLRIAAGEPLTLKQEGISWTGHAIQGRLCAEDPAQDFLPQTGPVLAWVEPSGPHIRVDHALAAGQEVSPWYDSMLGKVMVVGPNRLAACNALGDALARTELVGFEHNARYLQKIVQHPVFQAGQFSTAFLAEQGQTLLDEAAGEEVPDAVFVAAIYQMQEGGQSTTRWPVSLRGFSSTRALSRQVRLESGGKTWLMNVRAEGGGHVVAFPDKPTREQPDAQCRAPVFVEGWKCEGTRVEMLHQGRPLRASVYGADGAFWVKIHGNPKAVRFVDSSLQSDARGAAMAFNPLVKSPMNGKVLSIGVEQGSKVAAGDLLATLEAMKMEHRLVARHEAEVVEVLAQVGQQMGQGQLMIKLRELG